MPVQSSGGGAKEKRHKRKMRMPVRSSVRRRSKREVFRGAHVEGGGATEKRNKRKICMPVRSSVRRRSNR